jgi:hypothetical protein
MDRVIAKFAVRKIVLSLYEVDEQKMRQSADLISILK